jgi:hypothetical protein
MKLLICPVCKREFGRKIFKGGAIEQEERFLKRKFCSRTCNSISRERDRKEQRDRIGYTA